MFLLIDKPKGITSFDVIYNLRKITGIKKIGHAGTLDPNATGLMIIGVGVGTKKLKDFVGLNKIYEAEILFGVKTDSGDIDYSAHAGVQTGPYLCRPYAVAGRGGCECPGSQRPYGIDGGKQ